MGILRNNSCWDLFARLFGINWFYGGEISLSYGNWSVIIKTKQQAREVWLSVDEPESSTPVCCGDITIVGARVFKDHVLIDAKVRSDIVILDYWFRL